MDSIHVKQDKVVRYQDAVNPASSVCADIRHVRFVLTDVRWRGVLGA